MRVSKGNVKDWFCSAQDPDAPKSGGAGDFERDVGKCQVCTRVRAGFVQFVRSESGTGVTLY